VGLYTRLNVKLMGTSIDRFIDRKIWCKYEDTFGVVVKATITRVILSIVVSRGWILRQLDIVPSREYNTRVVKALYGYKIDILECEYKQDRSNPNPNPHPNLDILWFNNSIILPKNIFSL
jgi:hypothetical protein